MKARKWCIGRIPASENPENPGFHELIRIDTSSGEIEWTPSPSQALVFTSEYVALTKMHGLSKVGLQGLKLIPVP